MGRNLQALIDADALNHNLQQVRLRAPKSKIMAMIKANAYGHGMLSVARILKKDVDAFGVACLEEAIALRRAGIKSKIVLVEGFFKSNELGVISENNLDVVLHGQWQVDALLNSSFKSKISVWFKLNTGKNRLGFSTSNTNPASYYYNLLIQDKDVNIVGIMTHFASADELDNNLTNEQTNKFKNFCDEHIDQNIPKSLANSAAIINWPETHMDWVRPGLMLYGISPINGETAEELNLKPVMTLKTNVIAIQDVKLGESIGYNQKYIAEKDMLAGIIAIGYADGYKSNFSSSIPVVINGEKTNIVGRVSMDMTAIDLTGVNNPAIGDEVILWGDKGLAVEEIAAKSGIISYELVTSIGTRVVSKLKE